MKRIIVTLFVFFNTLYIVHAQKFINGFECVTSGVEYEYRFNAGWDTSTSIQVCVTGGIIANDNTACKTMAGLVYIKVKWDEINKRGSITVTYPKGSLTKNVVITPHLSGGTIDSSTFVQYVDYGKKPKDISCSVAKGGNCNPGYTYQWQQSANILVWENINGGIDKDLKFSSGITEQTFYRRKITDNTTGTIAYSEPVVVYVNYPM